MNLHGTVCVAATLLSASGTIAFSVGGFPEAGTTINGPAVYPGNDFNTNTPGPGYSEVSGKAVPYGQQYPRPAAGYPAAPYVSNPSGWAGWGMKNPASAGDGRNAQRYPTVAGRRGPGRGRVNGAKGAKYPSFQGVYVVPTTSPVNGGVGSVGVDSGYGSGSGRGSVSIGGSGSIRVDTVPGGYVPPPASWDAYGAGAGSPLPPPPAAPSALAGTYEKGTSSNPNDPRAPLAPPEVGYGTAVGGSNGRIRSDDVIWADFPGAFPTASGSPQVPIGTPGPAGAGQSDDLIWADFTPDAIPTEAGTGAPGQEYAEGEIIDPNEIDVDAY